MARALHVLGRDREAAAATAEAAASGALIAEDDDREIFERDLATLPPPLWGLTRV